MNIQVRAARVPWETAIELLVMSGEKGERAFAEPLVMTRREEKDLYAKLKPTLRLEIEEAQFLMDELWRCGLRPTEGTGSAGSLAATEKHLADMRVIALNQLGITEKKP